MARATNLSDEGHSTGVATAYLEAASRAERDDAPGIAQDPEGDDRLDGKPPAPIPLRLHLLRGARPRVRNGVRLRKEHASGGSADASGEPDGVRIRLRRRLGARRGPGEGCRAVAGPGLSGRRRWQG